MATELAARCATPPQDGIGLGPHLGQLATGVRQEAQRLLGPAARRQILNQHQVRSGASSPSAAMTTGTRVPSVRTYSVSRGPRCPADAAHPPPAPGRGRLRRRQRIPADPARLHLLARQPRQPQEGVIRVQQPALGIGDEQRRQRHPQQAAAAHGRPEDGCAWHAAPAHRGLLPSQVLRVPRWPPAARSDAIPAIPQGVLHLARRTTGSGSHPPDPGDAGLAPTRADMQVDLRPAPRLRGRTGAPVTQLSYIGFSGTLGLVRSAVRSSTGISPAAVR